MARVVVGVSGSLGSLAAPRAGAREARLGGREMVGRAEEAEAAASLGRAFEEAFGGDPAGVPVVRRHVLRGDPGRTLCEPAGQPDDLLVIGGRVVRGLRARAVCPVLTVPASALPGAWQRRLRRAVPADFGAGAAGVSVLGAAGAGAAGFRPGRGAGRPS